MRESKIKPAGTASLTYQNKVYELPTFSGTEGPNVLDVRHLYADADIFTYDEMSVAELFYTSGSTGTPKGVTLAHRTLYLHALAAATIYRELKGEGPEVTPYSERTADVTINKMTEEGRFLTVTTNDGQELHLRAAGDVDFEGVKDRSELKLGMKVKVVYLVPADGYAPLGFDIAALELKTSQ